MDISESNQFCNKSQTPNKIPVIILSQKHAHYEHFSSLPLLLFNSRCSGIWARAFLRKEQGRVYFALEIN